MSKILKKKRTLLIVILILFIMVLAGGLYVSFTKGLLSKFLPVSYADFSVSSGKTNLTFFIDPKDEKTYKALISELGVDEAKNISFQFDDKTTQFLSKLSPQRLTITFLNDKDIRFSSEKLPGLPSALSGKNIQFATKSGTLNINYQDEKDFVLYTKNPDVLLEEATKSGRVYLSKEIGDIFPIASKVATMKVSVDSGAVSGEITLK